MSLLCFGIGRILNIGDPSMKKVRVFLSIFFLFFISGCLENDATEVVKRKIPDNTIAPSSATAELLRPTATPEIIASDQQIITNNTTVSIPTGNPTPTIANVPTTLATPTIVITSTTATTPWRDEPINTNSNRYNSLDFVKKAYKLVYGEEFNLDPKKQRPLYINGYGKYYWKNKKCELICVEYNDKGPFNAVLLLIDEQDEILYKSAPIINDLEYFMNIYDVSYIDVDKNGYHDFVIIYIAKAEVGSARPQARVSVLFGEEGGFSQNYNFDFDINFHQKITSMDQLDDLYKMDKVITILQDKLKK